jgi:uncharacterized protein
MSIPSDRGSFLERIAGHCKRDVGVNVKFETFLAPFLAVLLLILSTGTLQAQVAITNPGDTYSQSFDALANSGTTNAWDDNVTIPGWYSTRTTYAASTGSSTAGNLYSFGASSDGERALGAQPSGTTGSIYFAVRLSNATGAELTALDIVFNGEHWRAANANPHVLQFQYQVAAAGAVTGANTPASGWFPLTDLDFVSPTLSTVGAIDGNDPSNRATLSAVLIEPIPDGHEIWLRWVHDIAVNTGSRHGLAIDDFSVTALDSAVLAIADAEVEEGDAGLTPMEFVVTLSQPAPAGGLAFTASTVDGTATAPGDYLALVDEPFVVDEGETTATVMVQIVGNTDVEPDKTFSVIIDTAAPDVVVARSEATGTILNDDFQIVEIYDIQGTGLRSPFAPPSGNTFGETVTTLSNVVTAIASNGFFMQTPDDRAGDAPTEASTGIFVFTSSAPSVQIGDLVDVTATVQEFFDWTQLTGSPAVNIVGSGALPEPVVLDETRPSPDPDNLSCPLTQTNFECFENMRVSVATGVAVTGNQRFGSDPYAEAYVTASGIRARREKGLLPTVTPPDPSLPVWDGNPEVFELDADGAGAVPNPTAIFGGDLFEAVGVISYQFGNYALRPTELILVEADEATRGVPPAEGDAELRVASFNVLNMCQSNCSPRLERVAAYINEMLLLPDVIGLQEVWTDVGLDQLAAHLNSLHGTDYVGYPGIANTTDGTGLRNAFLVRASRLSVTQVRNLDVDVMIDECSGTPPCVLHDRPPQLLEGTFDGQPLAVMNNHTRSFIGINNPPPNGPRVRFKRFEQAKSIARLVQRFQEGLELEGENPEPTDTADVPLVLVGDYNTFEVTDGYVDVIGVIAGSYDNNENEYQLDDDGMGGTVNITDPPLRNLVLEVPLEDRYSYTFAENLGAILGENPRTAGAIQVLDHGLSSVTVDPWCPELHYGRGNADAPGEVSLNGVGAVGSSDHDGLIVRLRTDRNGICEPAADLMVVVTAPAGPVDVGSVASFTVQLENAGPDAVAIETNTALLIAIDAPAPTITLIRDGQDFFDCGDPVPDTAQTARIFCDLTSTLERDGFETFTVNVAVPASLSGASLAVAAAVDSEFDDPQPANNSDQAAVDVALAPDAIFGNGFE